MVKSERLTNSLKLLIFKCKLYITVGMGVFVRVGS